MTVTLDALDDRAATNRAAARRLGWQVTWPLAVAVGVVVGIVAWLVVNLIVGIVVGLLVGVGTAVLLVRNRAAGATARVLAAIGARPATEAEFPRYFNLVEGLSMSNGVEEPDLYVLDAPGANALAVGAPGDAAVVLTTGLIEHLDRVELEGVLAEALYRIRVHEADLGAQAASFVAGSLLDAGPANGAPARSAQRRAAKLAAMFEERDHFVADISAGGMTRYPPGLRDAFVQLDETGTDVPTCPWGAAFLWMCDPFASARERAATDAGDLTATFSHHPPLQHRIDLLAEL